MSGPQFYLSQNPTVYEILTKEVRSTFTSEHDINFHITAPLEYLGACLNEILRVYPPAAETTPRLSPRYYVQGGWIPKGVRLLKSTVSWSH